MYYENSKIILDKNSLGKSYIIDVDTGFKAELSIEKDKICCWPSKVVALDIKRAKFDGLDISRVKYPFSGYSCKEVKKICERVETFLKTIALDEYGKVVKVLFNFI